MHPLGPLVEGIFVRELKNRFLCEVYVDNVLAVCYVSSSCRLENFLDLHGKKVLLHPTKTPNSKTRFSLFAVPYKRNLILLNCAIINNIISQSIRKRYFSSLGKRSKIYREYKIGGYKSDLFIEDCNTIVEIKSIISLQKTAVFPTVFSQRALDQLQQIKNLLDNGYNAAFIIASLSPYVEQIEIDHASPFYKILEACLGKGMQIMAVSICFTQDKIQIKKKIPVKLNTIDI